MTHQTQIDIETILNDPTLREPSLEANRLLNILDETYLSEFALAYPNKYYVSISVVCDIECPYCSRQYYPKLVDHGLAKDGALDLLMPYFKYSQYTGIMGLGEPFLHPRFFEIHKQVKATGSFTGTSSHGMTLNEENCRKIIESGLDELAVSIDGASKESFEYLRSGAVFETVVENVKRLQRMKEEKEIKKPFLNIACAISRKNVHEMRDVVALAWNLKADKLIFTDIVFVDPNNAGESVSGTKVFYRNLEQAMSLAKEMQLECIYAPAKPFPWLINHHSYKMVGAEDESVHFGCCSLWGEHDIERQGTTHPCCYVEGDFGNPYEEPMETVRNSGEIRNMRRAMIEKNLYNECRGCGRLLRLDRAYVYNQLEKAEKGIEAATSLNEGERAVLSALLNHYRILARQRFPEKK